MATISKNCIQHAVSAYNDERILRLRIRHKAAGYGIYWMLMEYLRACEDFTSGCDYNVVAYALREDAKLIKSVVEDFGLFAFTENRECFYSEELTAQMKSEQQKSEACKKAIERRWSKKSDNQCDGETDCKEDDTNVIRTKYERNTNVIRTNYERNTHLYTSEESRINGQNQPPPTPPSSNEFTSENKEKKETPFKKGVEKEEKKSSAQAPLVAEASSATLPQKKEVSLPAKKKTERPPTSERARAFYDRLVPYVGKYSREMIRAFYDYWSEANSDHSQMRFEKQPTFNLAMRLATWYKREKQYEDDRTNKYRSAAEQKREAHDYAISGLEEDIRKLQDGAGAAEELPDYILAALRPDQMGNGT
jgi:hypothetical protein